MKKLLAVLLVALLLVGCGGSKSVTKKGSYQSEADEKGNYNTAEVTLVDGKITEVSIDSYYAPKGDFKKALGADYGMVVASSIGKEWNEQIEALEQWMVGKTIDEVMAMKTYAKDENHTTVPDEEDLKSTCTMTVGGYLEAVKGAVDAAVEVTE